MPRRMKWYAGSVSVVAVAAVSVGVALAQTQSGPSLHSSSGGSGPGTQSGPEGQFEPRSGEGPPAAPAGSTTYSSKGSPSGRVVKSHSASPSKSKRHGTDAGGPSLHSSSGGSGPGTQSGPEGQFEARSGEGPPAAPAGSTTYSSKGSGSGKVVKSHGG
jgi:hypothetical protein